MKKSLLNEEVIRFQKIAGILNESTDPMEEAPAQDDDMVSSEELAGGIGLPYDDGRMAARFVAAATKLGMKQGMWNDGTANGDYSFDYEMGDAEDPNTMVGSDGKSGEGNEPSAIFILNPEMQKHPVIQKLAKKCIESYD